VSVADQVAEDGGATPRLARVNSLSSSRSNDPRPERVGRASRSEAGAQQRQVGCRRTSDRVERVHDALPMPASWHVDDAAEADVVVRVDDEPHVRERVP